MTSEPVLDDVPLEKRIARSCQLLDVTTSTFPGLFDENTAYLLEDIGDYVRLTPPQCSRNTAQYGKKDDEGDPTSVLMQWFGAEDKIRVVQARLLRGQFHPRIWRNGVASRQLVAREASNLRLRSEDLDEARPRAIALHRIQRQLLEIFEVVTPRRENAAAHGAAIQQLLALAAIEIEALLGEGYRSNCTTPRQQSNINDWVALAAPMKLHNWEAQLAHFPEWRWVRPFHGWTSHRAPSWWTANNKLKHEPEKRWMANLEAAINAVCGVRILLEAQFGPGIEELLPSVGLADITITARPQWDAVELYFPPARGAPLQPIPALR